MSFRPLKDLLPRAVRLAGISDQVQAAQVLDAFRAVVGTVLPPSVAARVEPLHVQNATLTLRVPSSAVAHELRLRQTALLSRLNQQSPLAVEHLQFRAQDE